MKTVREAVEDASSKKTFRFNAMQKAKLIDDIKQAHS
jgi:hypothetical protein